MTVRTRFAPSPTGYLHIGGARTALYCWLYARKTNGNFILRIEDTDQERSTTESVDSILESLQWLGLHHDEGPFYQSKHMARYNEVLEQLLAKGLAYRCYCTRERLDKLREHQLSKKQKPRYDGHCRNLKKMLGQQPYVIRFCNPQEGTVLVNDQVRGAIEFRNKELDDLVLLRSDGSPTYNFTVVVDDMDMGITHVIRGDDHLNNTPRQINIFKALDANIPLYAHVPMIIGADGKRLSKRHSAVNVLQYRDEGYLPEALLNYLVRLGWACGDQEIFSTQELTTLFDVRDINKAPSVFNPEKLLWINQHYIKTSEPEYVAKHLTKHMKQIKIDIKKGPQLAEVVVVQRERCKTLLEMAEKSRFFFEDFKQFDHAAASKNLTSDIYPAFMHIANSLETLSEWSDEAIQQAIVDTAETFELKLGKIAQPLRVAVTGGSISPPINSTIRLIGKQRTLQRLNMAQNYIEQLSDKDANDLDID